MAKKKSISKFHIKKGDRVIVVAGAYKNLDQKREVLEVLPDKYRAVVDGVNVLKKHQKPTNERKGGITEVNGTIHMSNLMLADPKTGEPTRVGRKEVDGKLVRYAKKSGEIIG